MRLLSLKALYSLCRNIKLSYFFFFCYILLRIFVLISCVGWSSCSFFCIWFLYQSAWFEENRQWQAKYKKLVLFEWKYYIEYPFCWKYPNRLRVVNGRLIKYLFNLDCAACCAIFHYINNFMVPQYGRKL